MKTIGQQALDEVKEAAQRVFEAEQNLETLRQQRDQVILEASKVASAPHIAKAANTTRENIYRILQKLKPQDEHPQQPPEA